MCIRDRYKDYIEFEEFEKLDIRVGKVLECEKVPKSSKLLRFTLQVGSETRQILSGIAKFHKPEELIGKNVLFVANLKPRKMMGLESCGMILSAEFEDKLTVLTLSLIHIYIVYYGRCLGYGGQRPDGRSEQTYRTCYGIRKCTRT